MPTYSDFQYEIYLAEDRSDLPFSTTELAEQARALLSPQAYSYVASGASSEDTMRENAASFRRWRIVPRMLRDVASGTSPGSCLEHDSTCRCSWRPSECNPSCILTVSWRQRPRQQTAGSL